ncbi:MAG: PQQ-like beta-propeller repeat protein [Candidatus Omnitrophica bacterium]|nr:PQQ-like beta-propeller repeat protein [Candidatus Omnitrophota bacterium]
MKTMHQWITTVAGGAILIGAVNVLAQDWPQWRGPNRDDKVSGFTAPEQWPSALKEKWKKTVGVGDATPALVGDRLYVFVRQGEDEVTLCMNAEDGKKLWENKYAAQAVTGPAARHPGPRSSPEVADGKVVTLGVGGVLSCLDAATGKELWRKDEFPKLVPQFFTGMSPIIVDGMCIAHLGGKDNGAVMAFDLATGNLKWKWTGDGPAYSSPILMTVEGTKQVVVLTEKNLVGIAVSDGKLLWETPASTQPRFYNSATPIVDGQKVVLTGQGRGTKAIEIEKQGNNFAVKNLWTNEKVGTGFSTPVLKNGFLFGLSDRGFLFCLNASNGEVAWIDNTRREGFGAVLDAGSVVLALPSNSELVVFKPAEQRYEELAKIKVADTPVYAHPVIAGNRVYVKDNETLTLWTF